MSPDDLSSLAAHVAHEWGDHGYRITGMTSRVGGGALFVTASDGSRFTVATNRYACRFVDVDGHDAASAFAKLDAGTDR